MKKILNRGLSFALAASALGYGLMATDNAWAQNKWPEKTVRMIVPAPPGSAPDGQIRLFSQKLSEMWGQPGVAFATRSAPMRPPAPTMFSTTTG